MNHPHIVKLIDYFIEDGNLCMICEYCEGGNLFQKFYKSRFPFPKKEIQKVFRSMVKALHHIHKKRIIYRDLKPENIVIKDGVYKLCDLGWAVELSNKKFRMMKAGTFTYAPPESLLNQL